MLQGAKVPPMVLSLLGAKVRGNESSIIRDEGNEMGMGKEEGQEGKCVGKRKREQETNWGLKGIQCANATGVCHWHWKMRLKYENERAAFFNIHIWHWMRP